MYASAVKYKVTLYFLHRIDINPWLDCAGKRFFFIIMFPDCRNLSSHHNKTAFCFKKSTFKIAMYIHKEAVEKNQKQKVHIYKMKLFELKSFLFKQLSSLLQYVQKVLSISI